MISQLVWILILVLKTIATGSYLPIFTIIKQSGQNQASRLLSTYPKTVINAPHPSIFTFYNFSQLCRLYELPHSVQKLQCTPTLNHQMAFVLVVNLHIIHRHNQVPRVPRTEHIKLAFWKHRFQQLVTKVRLRSPPSRVAVFNLEPVLIVIFGDQVHFLWNAINVVAHSCFLSEI